MNKAFIAICFWQSLPDLPPLGHHVPLTTFYRLVKVEENSSNFQAGYTVHITVICSFYVCHVLSLKLESQEMFVKSEKGQVQYHSLFFVRC